MALLPNRRWLRYSIRTLLVTVTVFCMWLGWQVSIVRERKAMAELVRKREGTIYWVEEPSDMVELFPELLPAKVSWFRRLLGDKTAFLIGLDSLTCMISAKERDRVLECFPENQNEAFYRYNGITPRTPWEYESTPSE